MCKNCAPTLPLSELHAPLNDWWLKTPLRDENSFPMLVCEQPRVCRHLLENCAPVCRLCHIATTQPCHEMHRPCNFCSVCPIASTWMSATPNKPSQVTYLWKQEVTYFDNCCQVENVFSKAKKKSIKKVLRLFISGPDSCRQNMWPHFYMAEKVWHRNQTISGGLSVVAMYNLKKISHLVKLWTWKQGDYQ